MKNNANKIEHKSLLDSAKTETQVKDMPHKVAGRVIVITLLFLIIFFSFLLSFSGVGYISFGKYAVHGTFTAERFYNTNSCALVVALKIDNPYDLKVGDEVFYNSAGRSGSAKFSSFDGVVVELVGEDGQSFVLNKNYVVGVVYNKVATIGVFFALFQTGIAGIIAMVLLLIYTTVITLLKINYENTSEGKRLFALFKKDKADRKERERILNLMDKVVGVDEKIVEMLSGEPEENKKNFLDFEKNKFTDITKKYEFILYKLHNVLVIKEELTRQERKCVSSMLMLLGEVSHITTNIEYMLVDLLLKDSLVDFRAKHFESRISALLSKNIDEQDILNLGSILYILFIKNSRIDSAVITDILLEYSKKSDEMGKSTQALAKNISLSIAKNLN